MLKNIFTIRKLNTTALSLLFCATLSSQVAFGMKSSIDREGVSNSHKRPYVNITSVEDRRCVRLKNPDKEDDHEGDIEKVPAGDNNNDEDTQEDEIQNINPDNDQTFILGQNMSSFNDEIKNFIHPTSTYPISTYPLSTYPISLLTEEKKEPLENYIEKNLSRFQKELFFTYYESRDKRSEDISKDAKEFVLKMYTYFETVVKKEGRGIFKPVHSDLLLLTAEQYEAACWSALAIMKLFKVNNDKLGYHTNMFPFHFFNDFIFKGIFPEEMKEFEEKEEREEDSKRKKYIGNVLKNKIFTSLEHKNYISRISYSDLTSLNEEKAIFVGKEKSSQRKKLNKHLLIFLKKNFPKSQN